MPRRRWLTATLALGLTTTLVSVTLPSSAAAHPAAAPSPHPAAAPSSFVKAGSDDNGRVTPPTPQRTAKVNLSGLKAGESYDSFIVKYRAGSTLKRSLDAQRTALAGVGKARGVSLARVRTLAIGSELVKAGHGLDKAAATALMSEIAKNGDVEYVTVNTRVHPTLVPDDPQYSQQWHYSDQTSGMNLPTAWDRATGSGVTVAVIDTGITNHSDLNANVVGGYDFITDPANSNDSDGRDADASDRGDWDPEDPTKHPSSWHGTHVAGTIAAATNNGKGVAGVAYGAKILPVRVLGTLGGETADIVDAIVWASGGHVTGVPDNTNPADVLNMSFGGGGTCDGAWSDAFTIAAANGAVAVAAAGNSNANADSFTPANCHDVLTVAATDRAGNRAWYSNWGYSVDVAAPGGETCVPLADFSGCDTSKPRTPADGILSTINTGGTTPGAEGYTAYMGTSMAAPHVAGLAALIKSVKPNATVPEIQHIITDSARPIPGVCEVSCGAGLIDAKAALDLAIDGTVPPSQHVGTALTNGVARTNLSGTDGARTYYKLDVPAGASSLTVSTSGGSGAPSLYGRWGRIPTPDKDDNFGDGSGTAQVMTWPTPARFTPRPIAGTYYFGLDGTYSGVSLKATYTMATGTTMSMTHPGSWKTSYHGVPVSVQLSATSSVSAAVRYTAYNLPTGLFLDNTTGLISGTPVSVGTWGVAVIATDATGASTGVKLDWDVWPKTGQVPASSIGLWIPPRWSGTVGTPSSMFMVPTSTAEPVTVTATGLPPGYAVTGNGGYIEGTPTTAGTWNATVKVTDTKGTTLSTPLPFRIHAANETGTTLVNGQSVWTYGAQSESQLFKIDVPAGATGLSFSTAGGMGDAELFVKYGSAPTDTSFDCAPKAIGSDETCPVTTARAGTYYVRLKTADPFDDVVLTARYNGGGTSTVTVTKPANQTSTVGTPTSLQLQASSSSGGALTYSATGLPAGLTVNTATGLVSGTPTTAGTSNVTVTAKDASGSTGTATFSWTVNPKDPGTGSSVLANGVAVTGISGAAGSDKAYTLVVPTGATGLKFTTSGGTGDADLYVKFGSAPTTSTYDCRSYHDGNTESCAISSAQAGTYYVLVRGYAAYSGLSLTGSYTADSTGGTSYFENTADYTIADNSTAVTSPITVSRAGNAPSTLKVGVDIKHPYISDLVVDLIAPDGTVYTLWNRGGMSDDNIIQTFTVNASAEVASGTWKLRVRDAASGDTGYLDKWSLQF